VRAQLVSVVEDVAGGGELGQDDNVGTPRGRRADGAGDPDEVPLNVPEHRRDLTYGHRRRCAALAVRH
jgi:hypothetical protein